MSTISGSCTENATTVLFEQGLEKARLEHVQQQKHQEINQQFDQVNSEKKSVTNSEAHLGKQIDFYA